MEGTFQSIYPLEQTINPELLSDLYRVEKNGPYLQFLPVISPNSLQKSIWTRLC
jgi:hypothetical protein